MLVYKITNILTGKAYIGQTKHSISKRFIEHSYKSSRCLYLSQAIQKYGKESFTITILKDNLTLDQANEVEFQLIKENNTLAPNGYNLVNGGKNRTWSEASRKKLSESKKGKTAHNKNKPMSFEQKQKLSKTRLGKHYPKLSAARKGCAPNSGCWTSKTVIDLHTGIVFTSLSESAKTFNIPLSTMYKKVKKASRFMYVGEI